MSKQGYLLDPLVNGYAVLDVETRYSAQEIGGWHNTAAMGVSIAVVYDSRFDAYFSYTQEDIPAMAEKLREVSLVVGFNIVRFDYPVLKPHAPEGAFSGLPTLDMLVKVHKQLSFRVSLDNLAGATLGASKSADGMMALRWWKEGKLDLIEEYCRKDVELTRDIFRFGRENGYLLYKERGGRVGRVAAQW